MKLEATIFYEKSYEYDARRLHHTGVLLLNSDPCILLSIHEEEGLIIGDFKNYDGETLNFLAWASSLEEDEYPRLISSCSNIEVSDVSVIAKALLHAKSKGE